MLTIGPSKDTNLMLYGKFYINEVLILYTFCLVAVASVRQSRLHGLFGKGGYVYMDSNRPKANFLQLSCKVANNYKNKKDIFFFRLYM